MNRFLSLLLLLACSFVAQAASPAYNTSTGVVSPTQFLKLDAAELKVMGVNVLTTAPNIYTTDGTLGGDRILNGGGNSLTFTNVDGLNIGTKGLLFYDDTVSAPLLSGSTVSATGGFQLFYFTSQYNGVGAVGTLSADVYADYCSLSHGLGDGIGGNVGWVLSPSQAQFSVSKTSAKATIIEPTASDGSPTLIVSSEATHTSGNLVEVKNNATNVFTIDYLGNLTANNINIPGDQTANNLTITNELVVRGSIKANTLIVTNTVNFYENTYVSNFFATATTVSNNLTVLGDYIGTIDPTVSGTTLKVQKSVKLQFPRRVDGAGCTYSNTNDYTLTTFMLPTFSGTAATNVNLCEFGFRVPGDLDTSKDLTASLTIRLTDVDTAAHTYNVGMISIANSSTASGTPANYVPLTVAADASGGSGDIESVNNVTLTDWRSNMTAGQWCLLRLNRDGDDDSTIASNMMELEIFYWASQ